MSGKLTTRELDLAGKEVRKVPGSTSYTTAQMLYRFWDFATNASDVMRITYADTNKLTFSLTFGDEVLESSVTWNKDNEWRYFLNSVRYWVMAHQSQCEKSVIAFFKR